VARQTELARRMRDPARRSIDKNSEIPKAIYIQE
jgi:hypothetical protein